MSTETTVACDGCGTVLARGENGSKARVIARAAGVVLREGDELALLPPVSGGATRTAKGSRRSRRPAMGHGDNDR